MIFNSPTGMSPYWFIGEVVDKDDPTNNGRVRVRVFGLHPEDPFTPDGDKEQLNQVEDQDLPWAICISGTYGKMNMVPDEGDWVFGFMADGRDAQHPMLLGVIPGSNLNDAGVPPAPTGGDFVDDNVPTQPINGDYPICDAYRDLLGTGLTHEQAIGVLVNIERESSFNPGAVGDSGQSFGLFQYYGGTERRQAFTSAVPDWQTNPTAQVRYAITQDPLGVAYANRSFSSSLDAANDFTNRFEIPLRRASYTGPGGYNERRVPIIEGQVANCGVNT